MAQLKWVDNITTRNRHIKDEITSFVETPCNEFRSSFNVKIKNTNKELENRDKNVALVQFFYTTNEYEEVKNERDFDESMLWSSIGGFVGMFAGYGLLQVLTEGLNWVVLCMTRRLPGGHVRP